MTTDSGMLVFLVVWAVFLTVLYFRARHEARHPSDLQDYEDDLIYVWLSENAKTAPPIRVTSDQSQERKGVAEWN